VSERPYNTPATRVTPAFIIYLLDCSGSMREALPQDNDPLLRKMQGSRPKIEVLQATMDRVLEEIATRAMKGMTLSPRYHVEIMAYNHDIISLTNGPKDVLKLPSLRRFCLTTSVLEKLEKAGVPTAVREKLIPLLDKPYTTQPDFGAALKNALGSDFLAYEQKVYRSIPQCPPLPMPAGNTHTADAFARARDLLEAELKTRIDDPAPLVCHLTDGVYNPSSQNPESIIREIMQMGNKDGTVLVSHIYLGEGLTTQTTTSVRTWSGISSESQLTSDYARQLFRLSSPLPPVYREIEPSYPRLHPDARMLFPGVLDDLIELGFRMSAGTKLYKDPPP
jgi:hypothetical protein